MYTGLFLFVVVTKDCEFSKKGGRWTFIVGDVTAYRNKRQSPWAVLPVATGFL